jgi:hypothetical protein
VVAYQIAYTFFLLPYSVLAQPIMTAVYPRLSSDALADRWQRFSTTVSDSLRLIAFLVLPATALMTALAWAGCSGIPARFDAARAVDSGMMARVHPDNTIGFQPGVDETWIIGRRSEAASSRRRLPDFGELRMNEGDREIAMPLIHTDVNAWVKNYIGDELAWDVQLILKKEEVPAAQLGKSGKLGWSTWTKAKPLPRDADNLILDPRQN